MFQGLAKNEIRSAATHAALDGGTPPLGKALVSISSTVPPNGTTKQQW